MSNVTKNDRYAMEKYIYSFANKILLTHSPSSVCPLCLVGKAQSRLSFSNKICMSEIHTLNIIQ